MHITNYNFSASAPVFKGYYDKFFENPEDINKDFDESEISDNSSDMTDDFYRTDELYDRKKGDRPDSYYRIYGDNNDVSFSDCIRMRYVPLDLRHKSRYQEYRAGSTLGSYVNGINTSNWVISDVGLQERLNQGFSKEDSIKIYQASLIQTGTGNRISSNLCDEGFELLKQDYPVDLVTHMMKFAKLKGLNDTTYSHEGLLTFITKFPDARSSVVDTTDSGREVFLPVIAENYERIYEKCRNEKDIPIVINDCRLKVGRKKLDGDQKLFNLASGLLDVEPEWTKYHHRIIKEVVGYSSCDKCEYINHTKYTRAKSLANQGVPPQKIAEILS